MLHLQARLTDGNAMYDPSFNPEDPEQKRNFWIGNALLAAALVMLLFINDLWQWLDVGALVLWMATAAAGTYFLMKK